MKTAYYLWSLLLVTSLVTLGLCIRWLALRGVPVSESLMIRGISCLFLVVSFARIYQLPLRPRSFRVQGLRALLAGLGLTFLSLSYNWLSASSVALLSNVDVPILVLLGPAIGVPAAGRARWLSLVSILLLILYVAGVERTHETLLYGLSSLLAGTLMLCFGYVYIKKSMNEENKAVAILTPAVAIAVYGLAEKFLIPSRTVSWGADMVFIGLLSGVGMFIAYVATMKLYALTDLAKAEFPALLSALVILPIECFVANEPLPLKELLLTLGFMAVTYVTMKLPAPEPASELPLVAQALDFTCGAACFESFYRYFRKTSLGEMHFAERLGSLKLGYTPVENVVALARECGFESALTKGASIDEVRQALQTGHVPLVTWWDEDAGHYSLVQTMNKKTITLMDPWKAREGAHNVLRLDEFVPLWQTRGAVLITVREALEADVRNFADRS